MSDIAMQTAREHERGSGHRSADPIWQRPVFAMAFAMFALGFLLNHAAMVSFGSLICAVETLIVGGALLFIRTDRGWNSTISWVYAALMLSFLMPVLTIVCLSINGLAGLALLLILAVIGIRSFVEVFYHRHSLSMAEELAAPGGVATRESDRQMLEAFWFAVAIWGVIFTLVERMPPTVY